jgi:hypothetical protein
MYDKKKHFFKGIKFINSIEYLFLREKQYYGVVYDILSKGLIIMPIKYDIRSQVVKHLSTGISFTKAIMSLLLRIS